MVPNVSVVILSRDHWVYTETLLSTLATTEGIRLETIVVDNGSEAPVVEALSILERSAPGRRLGLRCAFNPHNAGIASGRNQGAMLSHHEYLLFLDNDVEILDPRWLAELLDVALDEPMAGAVGAVLLNDDGRTVQFGGGAVDGRGRTDFWARPQPDDRRPDRAGRTMYCLGACLLTSRALWDQLGGFDAGFDPMDYEDIDYCLRAASQGRPSLIALRSRLLHHAHVTTGRRGFPRLRHFLASGRRFRKKWGHFL
jgi:GT2 family glycosyltransferase